MKYFAGAQRDDPRPVRGGAYNEQHLGSELFNFKSINERNAGDVLYGFVSPPERGGYRLNLKRISPTCSGDQLAGVTVIFVARQRIIGWYPNATVFRAWSDDPTRKREWKERGRVRSALYNIKASVQGAVLLPSKLRTQEIPSGKNGFGQANVRYAYTAAFKLNRPNWMREAITYVSDHYANCDADANLLLNPAAETGDTVAEALEQAAGFPSDALIRKVIEDHAMARVEREYRRDGYSVQNKSLTSSYDFLCEKGGRKVYVEVKGTQTCGGTVSLTHNEVEIARDARKPVDLCVVHSITITGRSKPRATGGTLVKYPNWDPRQHKLKPIHYLCKLTPRF
ncbi:MAG: DUF3883 domain-containing protein [Acidobacteriota bacterium]